MRTTESIRNPNHTPIPEVGLVLMDETLKVVDATAALPRS
jgi:hypothetical protein